MSRDKKKWSKTKKNRKNMEKENNTDESEFIENEIPDLIFLKPFEFEPKANIGDINSSQKQPSEVLCNKSCFLKFYKICRKRPVPESLSLIKLQV